MISKMNWANLFNYTVNPADMSLFQTYMDAGHSAMRKGIRTAGLVLGGQISIVAGLQIKIAAGLAIMPDGTLIEFPDLVATLGAAAGNPRIDRIELTFALTNGTTVIDNNNQSKTLDLNFTPSLNVVAGTPAASPAAPAATVANISLALVTVPASALALLTGNLSQVVDAGLVISSMQMNVAGQKGYLRYNPSAAQWQYSNDTVTWSSIGSGGGGGGSIRWNAPQAFAPDDAEDGVVQDRVFYFENTFGQKIVAFVKVPSTYIAGKPIKLNISAYSPSIAGNFKMQATAYLVRQGTDGVDSVANANISTTADVPCTVANLLRTLAFQLSTSGGAINGIAVSPGDLLRVELARVAATGTEDAGDTRIIPNSTEVTFS